MSIPLPQTDSPGPARSGKGFKAALRDWALPILSILVLAAAFGWDSWQGYQRRMSQEYHFLEAHARIADAQLSGALRAIDVALQEIAQRNLAAPAGGNATLEQALAGYAERFDEMRLVYITDAAGRVTAISDPRFAGFDASDREYFTRHRNAAVPDGLFISRPYVSAKGVRVVAVSRALVDAEGRFAGIVGASLEPKYFESVLDTVRPEGTGHALLVNTQGDILDAMPDTTLAGQSLKGGPAFEQHMAANVRSTRHLGMTKIGRVERVSVARRIDDTGLIVIVSRDHAEAIATWRSAAASRAAMFILAAAALLYLGWRGRRRQRQLLSVQAGLREREAQLRKAQEITHVGSWSLDLAANRLAWSDEAYRIFDVAPGTPLTYELFLSRVHPEDRDAVHRAWTDALSGAHYDIEHRILAHGETRWVRELAELEYGKDGKPLSGIGTTHDITEQKQAELQLRLAATVFENSREGVTITDLERNIISVNPAFTQITGYTLEEVVGRNPRLLQSRRQDASFYKAMWDSINFRGYWSGEIWNRRKNGEVYPEILSISVVADKEGRPTHYIGVFTDISERKHAEDEIRQLNADLEQRVRERTAELEYSNRELESFSYSVSHDLRAPLRAIDGFSHVIAEDYGEAIGETGRAHLQRIRRATQKMGTLIDNLLDLAQVSRQELRRETVDLSRIVDELGQELDEASPGRNMAWAIQSGLTAQGDPVLLKVALNNLLRNAWKFTAQVAGPRIEFGCKRIGGKPSYFVRDNGAGIDMAFADKLFQPFQRLHDPKEFEGTGIGLAIVHRVIRRHGGSIRVESAPGQGAAFFFTLE